MATDIEYPFKKSDDFYNVDFAFTDELEKKNTYVKYLRNKINNDNNAIINLKKSSGETDSAFETRKTALKSELEKNKTIYMGVYYTRDKNMHIGTYSNNTFTDAVYAPEEISLDTTSIFRVFKTDSKTDFKFYRYDGKNFVYLTEYRCTIDSVTNTPVLPDGVSQNASERMSIYITNLDTSNNPTQYAIWNSGSSYSINQNKLILGDYVTIDSDERTFSFIDYIDKETKEFASFNDKATSIAINSIDYFYDMNSGNVFKYSATEKEFYMLDCYTIEKMNSATDFTLKDSDSNTFEKVNKSDYIIFQYVKSESGSGDGVNKFYRFITADDGVDKLVEITQVNSTSNFVKGTVKSPNIYYGVMSNDNRKIYRGKEVTTNLEAVVGDTYYDAPNDAYYIKETADGNFIENTNNIKTSYDYNTSYQSSDSYSYNLIDYSRLDTYVTENFYTIVKNKVYQYLKPLMSVHEVTTPEVSRYYTNYNDDKPLKMYYTTNNICNIIDSYVSILREYPNAFKYIKRFKVTHHIANNNDVFSDYIDLKALAEKDVVTEDTGSTE